ncbi:MAG TPA: hypothetical protein VFP05_11905 [Thermomicrobiales bacterium]|nr:hypothetical protein [Thermomicrobiales bacterium]
MEDRRFDALAKAVAAGTNRRALLKGVLGFAGLSLAGGPLLNDDAQAARRSGPTPTPTSCPGQQVPCDTGCCCPAGLENCGPACCTGKSIPSPQPGHTECCDGACCDGTCYGEELCCPTNQTSGGGQPTHYLCDGPVGPQCCADGQGCCGGVCFDPEAFVCCAGLLYVPTYVCCNNTPVLGNCCAAEDCSSGGNCCNNECCDAPCCGTECCGNGWQCCNGQCYDPAAFVCCDGSLVSGVCCPGGAGCTEGQHCCPGVKGGAAYCTAAPCECDRICSDAGLDCCTIDNVFVWCYDQNAEGECCTVESCLAGQFCCGGTCTDLECEASTSCSDDYDCPGDAVCCVGDCCTPGQSCVTDPDNNSYCA